MAARRLAAVALAVVALTAAACGGGGSYDDDASALPAAAGEAVDLTSVSGLRQAFARADGSPRLLLLLSPT